MGQTRELATRAGALVLVAMAGLACGPDTAIVSGDGGTPSSSSTGGAATGDDPTTGHASTGPHVAVCGDGLVDPGESCDDGNALGGDGCSADCKLAPRCGDNLVGPGESCDDGNAQAGDGCSAVCRFEKCDRPSAVFGRPPIPVVGGGQSVAGADFDGDGDLDFVFGLEPTDIRVVFGDGAGGSTGEQEYLTVGSIGHFAIGSLDGSGPPDIVAAGRKGITQFTNDGSGTFTAQTIAVQTVVGAALRDLDDDGDLDLVMPHPAGDGPGTLRLYLNDGGNFGEPIVLDLPSAPVSLDATPEGVTPRLFVVGGPDPLVVFERVGPLQFETHTVAGMSGPATLVPQKDGLFGLITPTHTAVGVGGDTLFAPPVELLYPLTGPPAGRYLVGDLDGDGESDALAHFPGFGFGTYGVARPRYFGTRTFPGGALLDVDGDDDLDLASAGDGLFMNDGTGHFPGVTLPGVDAESVVIATLEGDAHDVVSVSSNGLHALALDGALPKLVYDFFPPDLQTFPDRRLESTVAADLDGDGDLDLAFTDELMGAVHLLDNQANDGTLVYIGLYMTGEGPEQVVAGDLDGDDRVDLATANGTGHGVTALFARAGGGYDRVDVPLPVDTDPESLVVGDLDGDGDLDLATANELTNDVTALLNDGARWFDALPVVAVGARPESLAAGDLDGDGDLDLATADRDADTVTVLLNDGDAGFTAAGAHAVGHWPKFVLAFDLDGDVDLDLAVANSADNTVSLLAGDGAGGFAPAQLLTVDRLGPRPVALAAGDLDGDCMADVIVGSKPSDVLHLFLSR